MNPFGRYKIISFVDDAREILAGRIPIPRMVSFWPTTICNYNCSFCLYKHENTEEHKIADTAKTMAMIDQLADAGVRSFEMSGGGEPTLHPKFDLIAEHACDEGLKLGLLTNGTNMNFDAMQDFRYIRIGLDAPAPGVYNIIKKPSMDGAFDKVLDNIRDLRSARVDRKRPRIGVKFLLNRINRYDIAKMVRLAIALQVDYVQFKGEHNGPDVLSASEQQKCTDIIESIRHDDGHEVEIFGTAIAEKRGGCCFMSPIHTVIDPNGNVFVCCFLRSPEYIIGNAFKDPFKSFWGKDRHIRILKHLDATVCEKWDCRWHGFNRDMRDIVIEDSVDIDFT